MWQAYRSWGEHPRAAIEGHLREVDRFTKRFPTLRLCCVEARTATTPPVRPPGVMWGAQDRPGAAVGQPCQFCCALCVPTDSDWVCHGPFKNTPHPQPWPSRSLYLRLPRRAALIPGQTCATAAAKPDSLALGLAAALLSHHAWNSL